MNSLTAYRWLAGSFGTLLALFGFVLIVQFLGYQDPSTDPPVPTGPVGYYFVAFTGCALIAWGGGLIGAAHRPELNRTMNTATVTALLLMSVVRMIAWVVGDYHVWLGHLPRVEAALFLLIALAFLWLRPALPEETS